MKKEEIIEKRDELREKLEKKIQNKNTKIGKIVYYKEFLIINQTKNHYGFSESDIFVVSKELEKNAEKIELYEIYDKAFNLIFSTNETGEVIFSKEYVEKLKNRSEEYYEKFGLEDRKLYLNREGEYVIGEKPMKEMTKNEKSLIRKKAEEQNKQKVEEIDPAVIENDMEFGRYDITTCIEICDKEFYRKVPEAKKYDGNALLIYSKSRGTFYVGGMKDGKFVTCDAIEPAKSTMKPIIDLDHDGNKIESEAITGVMRLKRDPNFNFGVDIELGGKVEFKQLRVSTKGIIAADLETGVEYRATKKVRDKMNISKNYEIKDEIRDFEDRENEGQRKITIDEIGDDKER